MCTLTSQCLKIMTEGQWYYFVGAEVRKVKLSSMSLLILRIIKIFNLEVVIETIVAIVYIDNIIALIIEKCSLAVWAVLPKKNITPYV